MESIADEILEEIFSYLDIESLKAAVEVSVRWSSLIKSSIRIGKNHAITIHNYWSRPRFTMRDVFQLDQVEVNWDYQPSEVDIPIEGLKYGQLIIINDSQAIKQPFSEDFQTLFVALEKYQSTIRKATFENFLPCDFVNNWLKDITHLKIIFEDYQYIFEFGRLWKMGKFEKLKWIEIKVCSLSLNEVLQWLQDTQPTNLRIEYNYTIVFIGHHVPQQQTRLQFSLKLHKVQELTFCISDIGTMFIYRVLDNFKMESLVTSSNHLKTFEIRLEFVDEAVLEAIKHHRHAETSWKNFTELTFKNIEASHDNSVNFILDNQQEISTLTLEYENSQQDCYLYDVPYLQKIRFKFTGDMQRSFRAFLCVEELEIRRLIKSATQMKKLFKFLQKCKNLKVLKVHRISPKVKLTPFVINSLFTAVKNLEELYLDAASERLLMIAETFAAIKRKGENLKKFTMVVDVKKAEEMREKMKIFNDTKVRTVVLEKHIVPTCENEEKDKPALCVWKK